MLQLNSKQKDIHNRALSLARAHAGLEFARVENLIEVEKNEVHKAFGKKMFVYATEVLGMDPGIAYPYIAVARASTQFPRLKKALRDGLLTVTKAGRIVSLITEENAEELIEYAQTHSKHEIEQEIARRNPKAGTRDRIRPLNREYDELKVKIKRSVSEKLQRVRSLNPDKDWEATIEELVNVYLFHKDPVVKAERMAKKRPARKEKPDLKKKFGPGIKRVTLTAAEKQAVALRDQGRCTFLDSNGRRCASERWTETHHLVPVSHGGTNDPENLTTLCSFHHDLVHQLGLPLEGQVTWLK